MRKSQRGSKDAFAQLNEAYQVLQDPKRRLHHLLELGRELRLPRRAISVPANIAELFPVVAALMQESDGVIRKVGELNQCAEPLAR